MRPPRQQLVHDQLEWQQRVPHPARCRRGSTALAQASELASDEELRGLIEKKLSFHGLEPERMKSKKVRKAINTVVAASNRRQSLRRGSSAKTLLSERSMVVQEGMEDAQDPFARRKTRPQRYFNVNRQRDGASDGENKGGASGDEADEADEGDAAAPEGGVDASFEALVSHVPNLKIDMGRLQMVANGNAQMGEQGSLAGFGHTLKHLPPRSNLMEVPTHVLTIEEYRSRHGI